MLTPIWGVVAVIGSVFSLQSQPAASQPAGPRFAVAADRPWWVREGLVIASVDESLSDRAWRTTGGRTRTPTVNEREARQRERSEPVLKALGANGATLVVVPYGGFGPDASEAEERKLAKETIARCHALGLRCGLWLPVGQVDPSVWKADGTDVSDWVLLNRNGTPVSAAVRGRVFTSDAVDAVRDRARRLVDEVLQTDADAVFIPDWRYSAGTEEAARAAFGGFLKNDTALGAGMAVILEKGGLPADAESPLMRPWVSYRTGLLNESLRVIVEHLRQRRPGMLVAVDCLNPIRQIGVPDGPAVDPPGLLGGVDAVYTSGRPQVGERGDIVTQIADLKSAVAIGARCLPRRLSNLSLVQQLAFGGDCAGVLFYFYEGIALGDDDPRALIPADLPPMVQRYRRRREVYAEMRPVADVLVWQPREVRLFSNSASDVEQIRAVSALVTHRIPFSYVYDELPRDAAGGAAVLVAGTPSMPEARASDLRKFVLSGGGVILVGSSAVVDSAGKTVERDLARYITESSAGPAATSQAEGRAGVAVRRAGEGRVVSLAEPGAAMNVRMFRRKSSKSKTAPAVETDDLAIAVRAANGRGLSVEGSFERGCAIELTQSPDGRREALHVVNFNPDGEIAKTEIRIAGGEPTGVWRYDIMSDSVEPISFRREAGAVTFETKPVRMYDAYLVERK